MTRFILLLALALNLGCADKLTDETNPGTSDDPVVMVEADDPEMAAAEAKAQETLDEFIKAMQNPGDGQSDFGVKLEFTEGEDSEHMWVTNLTYANDEFTGVLGNDPALVTNIKNGDPVSVKRADVEDWLYFDGEDMAGGYTVKLLMSRE